MGGWQIAGIVVAAIFFVAVVALVLMFARRQQVARRSASLNGHPAGVGRATQPGDRPDDLTLAARPADPAPALAASAPRLWRRDAVPQIREAEESDLLRLVEIDTQSEQGVAGSGLGALPSSALAEDDESASLLLVAGRPAVAYIRLDEVDGIAHIDRLAVLPAVAKRGLGRALIDSAIEWARERGYAALTLSTFADSDWNERVYDPTGFAPVAELSPGLVELRDWERAIGLDAIGARVVKRRELSA